MRRLAWIAALVVSGGCTNYYDVRIGGHVATARPDARGPVAPGLREASGAAASDLEPVTDAIVSITPHFGSGHRADMAYCGPVDESGAFRYTSSGAKSDALRGVSLRVKAPGFVPVERFVEADREGRFEHEDFLVVLEDARRTTAQGVQGAPPPPPR